MDRYLRTSVQYTFFSNKREEDNCFKNGQKLKSKARELIHWNNNKCWMSVLGAEIEEWGCYVHACVKNFSLF